MKIAVLSDTHNLLRPEILNVLADCDVILHGGDISSQNIVDRLRAIAPLYVVRGNNDKEWAEEIPHDLTVTLEGITFYLVHKKKEIPSELPGVDVVIYGHSHKYVEDRKDGIFYLNPGSCGPRRFNQDITMAVMEAKDGAWTLERIDIPHPAPNA